MHPRLGVSEISSWNWTIAQDLVLYEELGVTCIGASLRKMEAEGLEASFRTLKASGLTIGNLIGIGTFTLDRPEGWAAQRDRVRAAIDVAHRLGADCMIFTTGPFGPLTWEQAADALEEALGPLIPVAEAAGFPIALEHTNPLRSDISFLHSLRDAVELGRRLGTGVCMEINACWGERNLAATMASAVSTGTLSVIQVSDYVIGTTSMPGRAVVGDGHIPIRRILADALAGGYAGRFDLEILGPRIEDEGYASAIRRSVTAMEEVLADVGA
jgi:sugar phosphate isomerase/epimerase